MADVLNMDWLRMFDHRELQTLISGAEVPVDVDDLKQHTNYSGINLTLMTQICIVTSPNNHF